MNPLEIQEIQRDIKELFDEVGDSSKIKYKRLIESGDNFYDENMNKQYEPAVIIVALVKLRPSIEEISPIGRSQDCQAIFTVSSKELEVKSLLLNSVLGISLKDSIEYAGEIYDLVNIVPTSIIGGVPLLYKFEVKRQ